MRPKVYVRACPGRAAPGPITNHGHLANGVLIRPFAAGAGAAAVRDARGVRVSDRGVRSLPIAVANGIDALVSYAANDVAAAARSIASVLPPPPVRGRSGGQASARSGYRTVQRCGAAITMEPRRGLRVAPRSLPITALPARALSEPSAVLLINPVVAGAIAWSSNRTFAATGGRTLCGAQRALSRGHGGGWPPSSCSGRPWMRSCWWPDNLTTAATRCRRGLEDQRATEMRELSKNRRRNEQAARRARDARKRSASASARRIDPRGAAHSCCARANARTPEQRTG